MPIQNSERGHRTISNSYPTLAGPGSGRQTGGSGGAGTLFMNGKQVGTSRIEKTVAGRFGIGTFGVDLTPAPRRGVGGLVRLAPHPLEVSGNAERPDDPRTDPAGRMSRAARG